MMIIAMTCNDNDDDTLKIHDDTSIADHTNDMRLSVRPTKRATYYVSLELKWGSLFWLEFRPCFLGGCPSKTEVVMGL